MTSLNLVVIRSADIERSRRFYEQLVCGSLPNDTATVPNTSQPT